MRKREMINYVNGEKRMADLFGHSKDLIFDYSLSLSQILTFNRLYIILRPRGRVNIGLFLEKSKGSPQLLFSCYSHRTEAHRTEA